MCADGADCGGGGKKAIVKGHIKSPRAILLDAFFSLFLFIYFFFFPFSHYRPVYFKGILSGWKGKSIILLFFYNKGGGSRSGVICVRVRPVNVCVCARKSRYRWNKKEWPERTTFKVYYSAAIYSSDKIFSVVKRTAAAAVPLYIILYYRPPSYNIICVLIYIYISDIPRPRIF